MNPLLHLYGTPLWRGFPPEKVYLSNAKQNCSIAGSFQIRRLKLSVLFILFCMLGTAQGNELISVQRNMELMGSNFEFTVVVPSHEIGYINIEEAASEVKRIEDMISSWNPDSETSLVNAHAGISPVKVSEELFNLISRSIQISEMTEGAFDITQGPLNDLWKFDGTMQFLPTPEQIKSKVEKVGFEKIELNYTDKTVFLKEEGMKLSFGAIGKGYAVDKAKALLVSKGVVGGMINATGDITSWGNKATGEKWLIGIENPGWRKNIFTWLPIVESSVSINSTYGKYVMVNGKRYSHLINPSSGYPVSGIDKVTVLAKTSELCDALSTAVIILGKEKGLALINQLGGTEVIIADNLGEIVHSSGVLLNQ